MDVALGVGIFFELFWLDAIPAGTHIPPNSALTTIMCLGLASYFSLHSPSELPVLLAISLPLARLGARVENWRRRRLDLDYDRFMRWVDQGEACLTGGGGQPRLECITPGQLIWKAASRLWLTNFVICFGLFMGIAMLLRLLEVPQLLHGLGLNAHGSVTWGHCWLAAALGGALSLRNKRVYLVLLACVGVLTFWRLVGGP